MISQEKQKRPCLQIPTKDELSALLADPAQTKQYK